MKSTSSLNLTKILPFVLDRCVENPKHPSFYVCDKNTYDVYEEFHESHIKE